MAETRWPQPVAPAKVFHRTCLVMNTRFSMVLPGMDQPQAEALAGQAERDLRECERLMSRFDAEGPLFDLNRRAAHEAVEPPAELWRILMLCRDVWRQTAGAFDITLWPLNRLWRGQSAQGEEPTAASLQNACLLTGFHRVQFDERARTVRFEREGMSLDLGGFGKGYALDRVADGLRREGVERAFLSFGESSVTVVGAHPHGAAWPVGVCNLFPPHETVHSFSLRDASLSTSGTAPFNSPAGARVLGQIIDPRSGRPIEGYRTLSVAAASAVDAEVLSTALLVTPRERRAPMLANFQIATAVEIVYGCSRGQFAPRIEWKYGL